MKIRRILSGLLLLTMMGTASTPIASAAETTWSYGSWKATTEGGETVVTAPAGNTFSSITTKTGITENCCEFDIQILSSTAKVDGNIGFSYLVGSYEYFFEYNILNEVVQIRELDNGGADNHLSETRSYHIALNEWKHFKVIAATDYLRWYIDDELVAQGSKTSQKLEKGQFAIQGYYTQPAVKNIVTSTVEVPKDKTDFDFRTAESIEGFSCSGGELSWADRNLICAFTDGVSVSSPTLEYAPGHPYSALFPLRSTIRVNLKNDSSAETVRVSFITDRYEKYDTEKSAVYAIEPHSDYQTYYFNFANNPKALGYLRGFRLEFEGSGSVSVRTVSFEREDAPYEYAGEFGSCLSDGTNVTVKGTLAAEYAGKEVILYETDLMNYRNNIGSMKKLTSAVSDGTSFTLQIPFYQGEMTRLSSLFMLVCDGQFICPRFAIENYADFTRNPYAFYIPPRSVTVTDAPYGAKGDGYTDDTAAIQKALDDMSAAGGGRVIIPGDPQNPYGIRYIITNVKMRDNTELYISEGAVLWQSPREEDYAYEVAYGHNVSIPKINWTHAGLCHNLPLVQGYEVKNVRVTGGGTIRSNDCGSECEDGVDGGTIWTGCNTRIHVVPVAMYGCENVEVSDISLKRTNCYHMPMYACKNVYVGNVTMSEATCASGDGVSAEIGTNHMKVDRCFLFSNDDGMVLCSTYNEPRGLTWWHARPDSDNSISDIEVCHNYIVSGHGLTFIPWCTDNPDQSKGEIRDVVAYDNVFGGSSCAVGGWFDNPYYGGAFTNTATDDFSPIKNVWLYANRYLGSASLECVTPTNVITDCGIKSATNFICGNFERNQKKTFVSGLAYWLMQKNGTEDCVAFGTQDSNHFGIIRNFSAGPVKLYQGLYTEKATVTFKAKVTTDNCQAKLFIIHALDGKIIAELPVSGANGEEISLTAALPEGNYYFGIAGIDGTGSAQIDDAKLTRTAFDDALYASQKDLGVDEAFVRTAAMTQTPGPEPQPPQTEDTSVTEPVATEPIATEPAQTESSATEAETTPAGKTGCGSSLAAPALAVTAALAAYGLGKKKKH